MRSSLFNSLFHSLFRFFSFLFCFLFRFWLSFPLRILLARWRDRKAQYDGAIGGHQVFSRCRLNFLRRDGKEIVEDGVYKQRIVIEQRETRERMHQAESRNAIASRF